MSNFDSLIKKYEDNFKALRSADLEAKAKGTLVGRFIQHSYADSYACYRITKVTPRTATIEVVTGIGDDWVLPAWGQKANIPLKTAVAFIEQRDKMEHLFARK